MMRLRRKYELILIFMYYFYIRINLIIISYKIFRKIKNKSKVVFFVKVLLTQYHFNGLLTLINIVQSFVQENHSDQKIRLEELLYNFCYSETKVFTGADQKRILEQSLFFGDKLNYSQRRATTRSNNTITIKRQCLINFIPDNINAVIK